MKYYSSPKVTQEMRTLHRDKEYIRGKRRRKLREIWDWDKPSCVQKNWKEKRRKQYTGEKRKWHTIKIDCYGYSYERLYNLEDHLEERGYFFKIKFDRFKTGRKCERIVHKFDKALNHHIRVTEWFNEYYTIATVSYYGKYIGDKW